MKFIKLMWDASKLQNKLNGMGFQWQVKPVIERYIHISSPDGRLLYKLREDASETFLKHVGVTYDNKEN